RFMFHPPAARRGGEPGLGLPDGPFFPQSPIAPGRSPAGQESRASSMYAIVHISGVQTRVMPDEVLDVPRLAGEPGANLQFDQVLLVGDGDKISVGRPTVKGATVSAEILEHRRGEKLRIFKFKRRREYRRRRGHRDEITRIRVTAIKG